MVCGTHDEINAFKLRFSRNSVHTVNVSVIASFNVIFLQHVNNLAANEIAPDGREVEEEKNGFIFFTAQPDSFIKAHTQANDLTVNDATVIDRSNRVLL